MFCHKCGDQAPASQFRHSATVCDDCWNTYDMGRHQEVKPNRKAHAIVIELASGKLGITCPHCGYKIHRNKGYYSRKINTERCHKCMVHYIVRSDQWENPKP